MGVTSAPLQPRSALNTSWNYGLHSMVMPLCPLSLLPHDPSSSQCFLRSFAPAVLSPYTSLSLQQHLTEPSGKTLALLHTLNCCFHSY